MIEGWIVTITETASLGKSSYSAKSQVEELDFHKCSQCRFCQSRHDKFLFLAAHKYQGKQKRMNCASGILIIQDICGMDD